MPGMAPGAPKDGAGGVEDFDPGALIGGIFPPEMRASKTPAPPAAGAGVAGLGIPKGGSPAAGAAGFGTPSPGAPAGAPGMGGLGIPMEGVAPGAAGLGIPTLPVPGAAKPGVALKGGGVNEGEAPTLGAGGAETDGEGATIGVGATPGFLTFVGNVRVSRVPGLAFSATAPPPWAAKMVLTRANFRPVPANWGEAGCLGS